MTPFTTAKITAKKSALGNSEGGLNVLITGGAGFIGSHLCERLLESGNSVTAVDNFDEFYDPVVKRRNVAGMVQHRRFRLIEADIRESEFIERQLAGGPQIDVVVHLAARAGVRPSIEHPLLYSQTNLDGTVAVLELARRLEIRHFVFGSSSSVYGNNGTVPFTEADPVENPISPYAATKRAGELLCHTYHHLYGLSVVCLRFFTVYGPRQRPDLAIHKFAELMSKGLPVPMFGDGTTERDYTYIDDILQGIEGAIAHSGSNGPVFEIVNLGESETTSLSRLIDLIAAELDVKPQIEQHPPQPGDVKRTFANIAKARSLFGYQPTTPVEVGIARFIEWFSPQSARAAQGSVNLPTRRTAPQEYPPL
ncbi:GDP-mannose 4,6-dehydratase [soil metagenome]